jgi:pyruvate dehydrogenase E1 component alpha subunit/2-oxoisovalerate dehydrogenase E1 component alpha subunit
VSATKPSGPEPAALPGSGRRGDGEAADGPRAAAPSNGAAAARAPARGKTRSGQPEAPGDVIECWTDEDWARATGVFQVLDEQGRADPARVPRLSPEELRRMYRGMVLSRQLDQRLLPLQRQGRIGFYIGATGQEAGIIAGAHAIGPDDWFVPGLREGSAALYRGFPLRAHIAQIFGNANDLTRGRQMPCHSGSRASRHVVMSSCVSSQLPHATGLAMAAHIRGDKAVVLGYCGDGGTSEEDFHVALNFAAVYKAPVVFVCQNNQWAISTPLALQTASETIAVKGLAYGMPSLRVDGNDVLGMYAAVKQAVDRARAGGGPSFIEALTYRLGPHSSSDDPTRYRDEAEPAAWREKDPLVRFRAWLLAGGTLTSASEAALAADVEREVREAIAFEESAPSPPLRSLIEDVYAEPPAHLEEQLAELERVRGLTP